MEMPVLAMDRCLAYWAQVATKVKQWNLFWLDLMIYIGLYYYQLRPCGLKTKCVDLLIREKHSQR